MPIKYPSQDFFRIDFKSAGSSFQGQNPLFTVSYSGGLLKIKYNGRDYYILGGLDFLDRFIDEKKTDGFSSGFVGFISYNLGEELLNIKSKQVYDYFVPGFHFGFYTGISQGGKKINTKKQNLSDDRYKAVLEKILNDSACTNLNVARGLSAAPATMAGSPVIYASKMNIKTSPFDKGGKRGGVTKQLNPPAPSSNGGEYCNRDTCIATTDRAQGFAAAAAAVALKLDIDSGLRRNDIMRLQDRERITEKIKEYRIFPGIYSNITFDDYKDKIKKILWHIKRGDVYEIDFCQRFRMASDLPSYEIYQNMKREFPSPYGAYLETEYFDVLSTSPELFVRRRGNRIVTRPIKGTAGKDEKTPLTKSAKNRAELLMITDLERNDLGRICEYGKVRTQKLFELEKYKTLNHLVATVSGELKKGIKVSEIITALFPGGSITGAPKKRAFEIIDGLENFKRGVYTGAIGYITTSGDMEFNIAIRTAVYRDRNLYYGAGGGIVADSKPASEYDETLLKAKAFFAAMSGKAKIPVRRIKTK